MNPKHLHFSYQWATTLVILTVTGLKSCTVLSSKIELELEHKCLRHSPRGAVSRSEQHVLAVRLTMHDDVRTA